MSHAGALRRREGRGTTAGQIGKCCLEPLRNVWIEPILQLAAVILSLTSVLRPIFDSLSGSPFSNVGRKMNTSKYMFLVCDG